MNTNNHTKMKYLADGVDREKIKSTLISINPNELKGFNRHIHPRNIFRYHKPNFKTLAQLYPEILDPYIKKSSNTHAYNAVLDFTDCRATLALTQATLLDLYGLKIELPNSRLVPTVPQKLNYLHWIEDLLALTIKPHKISTEWRLIDGLDIGTGCSCIYALLGLILYGWSFLATEADATAYEAAVKNVSLNAPRQSPGSARIEVLKVSSNGQWPDILPPLKENVKVRFTLCNPPYHRESEIEPKNNGEVGATCETTYGPGGELSFFERMFAQSQTQPWQGSVQIFTTMLGKKRNLDTALTQLRAYDTNRRSQIHQRGFKPGLDRPPFTFTYTEFCQGKTMRWALAWTFQPYVKLPPPHSVFDNKPLTLVAEFNEPSGRQSPPTFGNHSHVSVSAQLYALLKDAFTVLGIRSETVLLKVDVLSFVLHVDLRSWVPPANPTTRVTSLVTSHMAVTSRDRIARDVRHVIQTQLMDQFVFACTLKVEMARSLNRVQKLSLVWLKGYNPMYMNRFFLILTDLITNLIPDHEFND